MLEQIGNSLPFLAFFTESKLGKTGLTVTVDVWRWNGTSWTEIIASASASAIGDGGYYYNLGSADVTVEGAYFTVFKTATTSVDQQHIPSLWIVNKAGVENLDAAVSSRAAIADYTTGRAANLDSLDAPVSSRLSAAGYTAPDNANIGVAALAATAASVASASADGKATTLINRLGAFAGAGLNTAFGFLRAIMRADSAITPSDVGGTYDNEEHSLEAIEVGVAAGTTLVINSTAPVLATLDAAGKLTIHRGDWTTFDLTLGSLVGRSGKKLVFTIKPKKGDLADDSDCYLQVTEVDGAVLINGSATGVEPTDASMTVIDQNTGQTRFVLKSDLTDLLPIGSNFHYDVQMFDAAGERHTKTEDRAVVDRDVTRRTS